MTVYIPDDLVEAIDAWRTRNSMCYTPDDVVLDAVRQYVENVGPDITPPAKPKFPPLPRKVAP